MADEKAKPGVKVRCSRCQQVFPVQVPTVTAEAAREPVIPAAAPRETQPAVRNVASPAISGPKIEGFDFADFSLDTGAAADPAVASGRSDELDLGDFSADEPQPVMRSAPELDDFTFEEDSSAATEFSFGELKTDDAFFNFSEQAPTKDVSFEADAAANSDIASADFSFDEEPADDTPGTDGEESFSFQPAENEFSFGDISPNSAFSIDAQPAAQKDDDTSAEKESTWSSGAGSHDDFDFTPADPASGAEEFDFSNLSFGEESPPASSTPPLSPAVSAVLPPLAATHAKPPQMEEYGEPFPDDELPMPPQQRKSGILGLAIVLLLLLSGIAGYFFWQGKIPDFTSLIARITGKTPPPPVAAGQIRVSDLNSYFVDNAEAGQLFVIQGRVVNEYAETRSAIAVKGVLFGQSGQPLMQQTVFPGNMLNESTLRTLPFAKIEESMNNQFGDSLSNLNIAPGKSIPFTIVFRNLPSGLAEFTAEVSDSKPGSS
jgi:hypothetical protein